MVLITQNMGIVYSIFCNDISFNNSIKCRYVNDDMTCVICLDERTPSKYYLVPCGHLFHKKCIIKWFNISKYKKCPYCCQKVTSIMNINNKIKIIV
jgi:hypothetical protein